MPSELTTPSSRRRKAISRAIFWAVALCTWVALSAFIVSRTSKNIDQLALILLCIAAVIAFRLLFVIRSIRRNPPAVTAKFPKAQNKTERKFLRTLRHWESLALRTTGLHDKQPNTVNMRVPTLSSIRSVPLGFEIGLSVADRKKPVADAVDAMEAMLRINEVRLKKSEGSTVTITAVLTDPLAGMRSASEGTSTKLTIGRTEDGEEATIDLADASHIIMQGATRSGKSQLCYVIFGQLFSCSKVQILGIDPNRVLLEPLAQATDPNNFALGSDPLEALELLERVQANLLRRLDLLTEMQIDKHTGTSEFPYIILILEEYPGLLRRSKLYDKDQKPADRITSKIEALVQTFVAEGAKAGLRIVLIAQRADAEVVDGQSRGQFGTRISMSVDNGDAIRMLHPTSTADDPDLVGRVLLFPPGRALYRNGVTKIESTMQVDWLPYEDYRRRLGLPPAPEPNYTQYAEIGRI